MKILMLTWEYPPRVVGGIARVVHDLSHRLIKDGHEVTVVTYKEGNVEDFEDDNGVKVYRVNNYMINPNNFIDWIMQLNFNLISKATEIINKEGPFDVIHAHDWLVAYAAKTLKDSFKTPIIATIHATEAGRNSGIHDEVQRYINDTEWMLTYESTEVIVNSNYMKSELQRLFGLPYEKINVVPNGVNLNLYNGVEKDYNFRRQYAADNEKIILYVGRLVYEKGIQNLIAAMPKVLNGYHDSKLIIAGKGGMIDELRDEVRRLNIENKVYFTGYLNLNQVKKGMQIFLKDNNITPIQIEFEPTSRIEIDAWKMNGIEYHPILGEIKKQLYAHAGPSTKEKVQGIVKYLQENRLGQAIFYCSTPSNSMKYTRDIIEAFSEEKEKKIPYDFIEHLKKNIMLKLEKVKIVRCTGVWFKH